MRLVPENTADDERTPRPGAAIVIYSAGQTVAQAVYLFGPPPRALCSGIARCNRCRMRLVPPDGANLPEPTDADRDCLAAPELEAGMRLACRVLPVPGLLAELPPDTRPFISPGFAERQPAPSTRAASPPVPGLNAPLLAVDLGTTSMQWRLLALPDGPQGRGGNAPVPTILWKGGMPNPQMGAGSDIVSRISVSLHPSGRERLRNITQKALRALLAEGKRIARHADYTAPTACLCLAGNSAMTAIALGINTGGLAAAPLSLPHRGGEFATLPGLPPVWIPPQISPFVGGDVSARYASPAYAPDSRPRYPFLLADMGTNGEFLLTLSPDKALAASVALGPDLRASPARAT